jgi:16S rRNA G966 N2-methylase RsmD
MRRWLILAAIAGATAGFRAPQFRPPKLPEVRYVPTPQSVVDAMLELAQVTAADVVYDLGSGDGRIPITAAQRYGARGVGIEIDKRWVDESIDNAKKANVSNRVVFLNQDLFESDISPATVITLFLMPRMNQRLIPALKTLRPGTRIVAHMFDLGPEWPAERTEDVNGLTIYLWTIR